MGWADDPELVATFRAEVEEDSPGRWVAIAVGFADGRVLRRPDGEE